MKLAEEISFVTVFLQKHKRLLAVTRVRNIGLPEWNHVKESTREKI